MSKLRLFCQDHSLDIVLVSETHSKPNDKLYLQGYDCFRTDRIGYRGGGVAVFVRKTLAYSTISTPQTINLELVGVTVHTKNAGDINIFSAYSTPHNDRRLSVCDLISLFPIQEPIIVAGDFNAKHTSFNCRVTTPTGKMLYDFINYNNINCLAPDSPTFHGGCGLPDVLDIALIRNVSLTPDIQSIDALTSDHNPVILTLGNVRGENPVLVPKTDWIKYQYQLDHFLSDIPTINSISDIDSAVETIAGNINSSIDNSTTLSSVGPRVGTLPQYLLRLKTAKNKARRRYRRTLDPNDRALISRANNAFQQALREHRDQEWQNKLESLSTEDNSLYRMNRVLGSDRSPMPPIHSPDGSIIHAEAEKAEAFALNFETQCLPSHSNADNTFIKIVEDKVQEIDRTPISSDDIILPATVQEVTNIINSLKNRKAPGPDKIPNRALKLLPLKGIVFIVSIINAIFRLHYFPDKWKNANVIFIPKPLKDRKIPGNYRPISLLNTIAKIAERVILNRLQEVEADVHIIPDEQFGFRSNLSTSHQVLRVTEFVNDAFSRKQKVAAVFLDVAKAFDSVWHDGLVFKLHKSKIPPSLLKIIKSFLTNRSFQAKIGTSKSTTRPLRAGVPQGSVLSPTLFNLYLSDFPFDQIRSPRRIIGLYADDLAIFSRQHSLKSAASTAQSALKDLQKWYAKWRIKVNAEKSQAVMFNNGKGRNSLPPKLKIFDSHIPWCTKAKYLGVYLDDRLTFASHILYASNRARQTIARLYHLFTSRSLSPRNKLLLYKVVVRPVMTYCSMAWAHAEPRHLNKLQIIQNKVLRMTFHSPYFVRNSVLHDNANLPTIVEFITEITKSFINNSECHPNHLVRNAVAYQPGPRQRRPRHLMLD